MDTGEEMNADTEEWQKLASTGQLEYQLKLGQHLLVLAESGDDISKIKNGKTALSWLIKASKQGSEEATKLLKKCVKTGTGCDETNKEDLDWCIKTPSLEKKIRFAAKAFYEKVNKNNKEKISGEEFKEAVKKLTEKKSVEQQLIIAAGKKIGDSIGESDFVNVVTNELQGKLTLVTSEASDTTTEYDHASIFEKITKYPKVTAMSLFNIGFETVSTEGVNWVMSLIPTNQIYLLTLFYLYSVVTTKMLFQVVPLVVFYLSIFILIITTFQMFHKRKIQDRSTKLAKMMKLYERDIDIDQVKAQLTWNSLAPYFIFFAATPIVVISFSLSPKRFVPCSELCVFSGGISLVCFFLLSDPRNPAALLSSVCTVITSLPIFFKKFPKIPIISKIIEFPLKPLFVIDLTEGFSINFGLPTVAYLVIIVSFLFLAKQQSWRGIYTILVPQLVFYFWFNLMTISYSFATWQGVIRASVGYIFLPIVLPVMIVVCLLGGLYGVYVLFQTQLYGKLLLTVLFATVPVLLTQTKLLFGNTIDQKYFNLKKIVMIIFSVLAIVPLVFIRIPSVQQPGEFKLTFSDYSFMCGTGIGNSVSAQRRCSNIAGQEVTWKGQFQSAKITKTENSIEPLLSAFPTFISNQLRCFYGQEFGDCEKLESEPDKRMCHAMKVLGKHCHLKNKDTYTFQLIVTIENTGESVLLEAGNEFQELLFALTRGDVVQFSATLGNGIGTDSLSLQLNSLACISREISPSTSKYDENNDDDFDDKIAKKMKKVLKLITRFFWYPLLDYKPKL